MIAKIAVSAANYAIDKPYSYRVEPEHPVQPGQRVLVPFGRGNRRVEGVVLSVEQGQETGLKTVDTCLDQTVLLSDTMLHLAAFIRDRCFCTFYEAVRAMLPAGLWFQTREYYDLTGDRSWKQQTIRQKDAVKILELLESRGGQAEPEDFKELVPDEQDLARALRYLTGKKWVNAHSDFLRRTGDKTEKVAALAASAEEAMEFAAHRPRSAAMQRSVLELLVRVGTASVKDIFYYTGARISTITRLEKLGYLTLSEKPVLRCAEIVPDRLDGPLVLNEQQEQAFRGLKACMERAQPGVALLHGVTGSGKTAVYLSLIRHCLDQGKSALLLVPEIALTPQLLGLLAAHFGQKVAVQHSSLGVGERYDQWKRIRAGEATVVVGTRSAVFAPLVKPGIIILDEEQEHSYKSENVPRYSAVEAAIWRGARENMLVLLGSATPSVESMYRARTGVYHLFTLHERYNGRPLPAVKIVDMREEIRMGNDSAFSYDLLEHIQQARKQGRQSILFLNRRGNSRALVCVDCREAPECPRCSARLTYHSANRRLMCHHCGYSQPVPERCPRCGGPLKPMGVGTQKLEEELRSRFPEMEVLRMDTDTVSAVNTHEKILERFQKENIPVLIGTQMVAKGLNLPNVTLVGVLNGDMSLYADHFRAAETTFNMITQVVGRSGRGTAPGTAIIQTMVPEHRVIELAARQDYDGFYEVEIALRRIQRCPPFGDLTVVNFVGQDEARVLRGAAKFRDSLREAFRSPFCAGQECTVLGPAPCVVPKINYNFRYRLTVHGLMNKPLRTLMGCILKQFLSDGNNRGVSAFVDINGFD